jgi:cyanophycinase
LKNKHLFLFGGSPPFGNNLGKRFADFSVNDKGKVGILFIERDGWKEYMKKYTCVLEANGLMDFVYLPLSSNPSNSTIEELRSCTGLIICGGETELYQCFVVNTPIGKHIKEMYVQGVPVAGFSAGALISPTICVIPPIDNSKNKHLFLEGLGLLKDCVISVHFSK